MSDFRPFESVAFAEGEKARFSPGDEVYVLKRFPIGHFRVPNFVRGKRGIVEAVIEPTAIDNEEEAYGRNAGKRRHYYRIAIPMKELWASYNGSARDGLRIEIFETWLKKERV